MRKKRDAPLGGRGRVRRWIRTATYGPAEARVNPAPVAGHPFRELAFCNESTTRKSPLRDRFGQPTILAIALLATGACGDDVTDPEGLLESAEVEAVMRSAEALPTLPELLDRVAPTGPRERATAVRARELWGSGGRTDDGRGEARRGLAVRYALPLVIGSFGPGDWAGFRDRTEDWILTAESMLRHLTLPEVERRLAAARRHLATSDRSRVEEDRIYYLLLAGSVLVETTPRCVARSLADRAGHVLGRERPDARGDAGEPDLERAWRLKDWADRAVQEGEYLLAIQRAYYAIQLAEAR